jgi:hypothetical protein
VESKIFKAKLVKSYILKVQELTIDVLEVKLVKLLLVIVKSSTLGTLELTIDILKALLVNIIKASLVKLTSTLLKL